MHKNLRLFYFLLLVTAIAAGVRYMDTQEAAEISKAANAADFAIADTAAVDKIFIADKDGNQALLERSSGRYWKLNGTHLARKDAVDLLLKTFLRARVQRPVPQGELSTVNRLLAGRGKKVEIYQGGETPVKTWYIGTSTQNHTGTYMVLADANGQLAEEPFIVHMEGFTGFLSTRFFTDEREWRYTGMFDYPGNSLRRVEVELTEAGGRLYAMEVDSVGTLRVEGAPLSSRVDTLFWQDRFNRFRKVHLETYNNHLTSNAEDSLLNRAEPAFRLRAWGQDEDVPNEIELYWKAPISDTYDDNGELNEWDGSRMYAVYKDEAVLVQRFVFDPLLAGLR
ncbi:MAG: hypothetical protein VXY58_00620 [Bacteroidota bacterium]|nr:hypothetical protein [Bacteroidota bacterium]